MLFGNPFEAMKKKNESKRRLAAFNSETKCETQHSLVAVCQPSSFNAERTFFMSTRGPIEWI